MVFYFTLLGDEAMKSTMREIVRFLFCLLTMAFFPGFSVRAEDVQSSRREEKTVRVAYVQTQNFLEGGEGERKSGYGYEYLQKISYYTGWKYEYIYGNFQESLDRLMNGEVDLMSDLVYSDERAQQISFSEMEQGEAGFYVFGSSAHPELADTDWSDSGTLRIGVGAGSYSVDLAKAWCENHRLDYELVEYTDMQRCSEDLVQGNLDIVIASELYANEYWIVLEELGKRSFYYGVAKERTDLLEELNQAMRQIRTVSPFYNHELLGRYITSSSVRLLRLSDEERKYLSQNRVRIGYLNDYMPYCGSRADTGESGSGGMMDDILTGINQLYPMDYETAAFDSYEELLGALEDGTVDAIFPVYGDYSLAESLDMMVSDAVTHSTMMAFHRIGEEEITRIAVTENDPFQQRYAAIYYPDARLLTCENIDECMKMVAKGIADLTIAETAKVNEYEQFGYKDRIQKAGLQEFVDISFAVRRGNTELLSVLNKGLKGIPDSLITNSLILHSQEDIRYTVVDFLKDHILAVCLTMFVGFSMIIGNLAAYYMIRLKSQRRVLEAEYDARAARWKSRHDALTGLLNRTAFQELCHTMGESNYPMALLIMDVDKFKDVNDTYGHEVGDRALIKVGDLLMRYFRTEDHVIRFAGDEFLVMMEHTTSEDRYIIASKINQINDELQHPEAGLPKLSLSVGIAFSADGYHDDLFRQADLELYRAKKNGRCGYSISFPAQEEA
jgi:diguanylate cyclase (GGDEF)-like protein